MKKQFLKLSFILIFLIFALNLGESKAFASNSTPANPAIKTQTVAQKTVTTSESSVKTPQSIPEKNKYALTHIKKDGFRYKFFKFLMAMLGVFVSSLAILGGLKIYKILGLKNSSKIDTIDYEKNLESPKNFKEAINLFLDKTDK